MSDRQRPAFEPDPPEALGPPRRLRPLVLALLLAAVAYAFPLPGIPEEGRRLTAILMVVATLWIGEAIPLAVTALLGPSLAVLCGVASVERAFAAFGNPIIMLFVGSFLLARATFKHRLNERIAYRVLSLQVLRDDPTRAFLFLGLTTAALSAWMSNTATCAMMLPIAQSVLGAMVGGQGRAAPPTYAAALMLIVAYSASIGGLFTPIGTPPNLIGLGLIEQATGTRVTFVAWLVRVFPITALALLLMMIYLAYAFRDDRRRLTYDRAQMVARYAQLGPWKRVEKRVIAGLLITVSLWLFPPLLALISPAAGKFISTHLAEAVVPLLVAAAFFWLRAGDDPESPPVLSLPDLGAIDWAVVVLFGGGMCLGDLMIQSGLARALGDALANVVPAHSGILLVLIFSALTIGLSEATSNTASANMAIPIVMAVATRVGGNPVTLGLAATAACTFGFMLPVSTPTNAMAYATGYVTQRQMIRYGILLDVIGIVLLTLWFGLVV